MGGVGIQGAAELLYHPTPKADVFFFFFRFRFHGCPQDISTASSICFTVSDA